MLLLGLPKLWVGLGHSIPVEMHHRWLGVSLQKLCGSLWAGKEPCAGLVCNICWLLDIGETDRTSWNVGTFSSSQGIWGCRWLYWTLKKETYTISYSCMYFCSVYCNIIVYLYCWVTSKNNKLCKKYATQTPMQKWKPFPVVFYLLLQNNFPTQFLKWSVLTELL